VEAGEEETRFRLGGGEEEEEEEEEEEKSRLEKWKMRITSSAKGVAHP
jgi:hypothetical protein